jgi:multicomponent Na+:H+ antiporter subunit G
MSFPALLQSLLLFVGAGFFVIGTVGLLRLPDTFTRLHALTKVDNLGLGLIVMGLLPSVPDLAAGLKLLLIWFLTLGASATAGHLVAQAKYYRDQRGGGM